MGVEMPHRLLGTHNFAVFPALEGTPPFSSFIADLSIQQLLQDSQQNVIQLWDPFCGNGIIVRTAAVLHRQRIKSIFVSDCRESAVQRTAENLERCHLDGFMKAINDIQSACGETFRRLKIDISNIPSEFESLLAAHDCVSPLPVTAFTFDVLKSQQNVLQEETIDLICTDPPYEDMESHFEATAEQVSSVEGCIPALLRNVRPVLRDGAKMGLILNRGDYQDLFSDDRTYKLMDVGPIHKNYRSRFLYRLQAE